VAKTIKDMVKTCILCNGKEGEGYLVGRIWKRRKFRYDPKRCDQCYVMVAQNEADGEL